MSTFDCDKFWSPIFDIMDEFVFLINKDFTLLRVNKSFLAFIKKKLGDVVGKKCYQIVHDIDQPFGVCPLRDTIRNLDPASRDIYDPKLQKWLNARTTPIFYDNNEFCGVVHLATNITARKNWEKELQNTRQKYSDLVHNIPGMVYHGRPDWTTDAIFNCEMISGYTPDEFFSGQINWLEIIHREDKPWVIKALSELLKHKTELIQEYRIIAKEGDTRWVSDHKSSRFTKEGDFDGVDGVVFDITYRKKMLSGQINSYHMEKRYFHKRGRIIWILLNASIIHDALGKPIYSISQVQDITDQKEAETKTKRTCQRFRTAKQAHDWTRA